MWYPFYYNPNDAVLLVRENRDDTLIANGYVEILPIKPDGSEGRWRWGYSTADANISFLVARIMPKYQDEQKYTIYDINYKIKMDKIYQIKMDKNYESVSISR